MTVRKVRTVSINFSVETPVKTQTKQIYFQNVTGMFFYVMSCLFFFFKLSLKDLNLSTYRALCHYRFHQFFAVLLHLHVLDNQTHFNIRKI